MLLNHQSKFLKQVAILIHDFILSCIFWLFLTTIFILNILWARHYYAAINVVANGSFTFAAGETDSISPSSKVPCKYPFMPPKTSINPTRIVNPCPIHNCLGMHGGGRWKSILSDHTNRIRHGFFCDGSSPKWQVFLSLKLLTPGPLMEQLAKQCRNVILASGSLSPICSLTVFDEAESLG